MQAPESMSCGWGSGARRLSMGILALLVASGVPMGTVAQPL